MPDFNDETPQREPHKTIDKEDVLNRLLQNVPSFVKWLFQGRALIHGNEARIGSVQGEKGQSLSIDLKTGLWFDHATLEKGDLFGLYIANQQVTFPRALEEIAGEYLRDQVTISRNPFEKTATQRIEEARKKLGDRPHRLHLELGARVAVWKYYDLAGNIVASVERYEPETGKTYRPWCFKKGEDGRDRWVMGAPEVRPLYNLASVAQSGHVVLVEGEKCAETLIQLGIPATTAMQGAGAPIDKTDWSLLRGKHIIVWPDNDKPGLDYGAKVAAHLSQLGCSVSVLDPRGQAEGWDAADCVADGKDVQEFLRTALLHVESDFRIFSIKDLQNRPKPRFLVQGAIPENSIGMLWAPSGQFKTFIATDLMLCIAHGIPWHSLDVVQGPVLYFAEEDPAGVVKRITGWHRINEREEPDGDTVGLHIDGLTLVDSVDNIIRAATNMKACFIVIETVAMVFGAGNENHTQDMNSFVQSLVRIRRETGAAVAVVHHTGRQEDRERGNVALRAACDWVFRVKRLDNSLQVDIVNEPPDGKAKNSAPLKTLQLEMKTANFVYQGTEDSTLYPVLAQRVEDDPDADYKDSKPRKAKVGNVQRDIIKVLEDAGEPLPIAKARKLCGVSDISNFRNTVKGMIYRRLIEEVQVDDEPMLRLYPR